MEDGCFWSDKWKIHGKINQPLCQGTNLPLLMERIFRRNLKAGRWIFEIHSLISFASPVKFSFKKKIYFFLLKSWTTQSYVANSIIKTHVRLLPSQNVYRLRGIYMNSKQWMSRHFSSNLSRNWKGRIEGPTIAYRTKLKTF